MTKKPFLHALAAALYIVAIALLFQSFQTTLAQQEDTILAPITMLSLFVFSAAVMGYLFLSEPLALLVEKRRAEAITFFAKTVGLFAIFVLIFVVLLFGTALL